MARFGFWPLGTYSTDAYNDHPAKSISEHEISVSLLQSSWAQNIVLVYKPMYLDQEICIISDNAIVNTSHCLYSGI